MIWMDEDDRRATEAERLLTGPQRRYLAEIRANPGKTYNGRARKPLEALRAAGLVEFDYERAPTTGAWSERFTCRPTSYNT